MRSLQIVKMHALASENAAGGGVVPLISNTVTRLDEQTRTGGGGKCYTFTLDDTIALIFAYSFTEF